jgi:glucosamine-6-phosphate deaminase
MLFPFGTRFQGGELGFDVHEKWEATEGCKQWCKKNFVVVKRRPNLGERWDGSVDLQAESSLGVVMKVLVAKNRDAMGNYSGNRGADLLAAAIDRYGFATLLVATGSSQFEVLAHLVASTKVDWSKVDAFHLDEYIGVSREHPASFCGYLEERFVKRVPLRSFHYLDGTKSAAEVAREASAKIRDRRIDVAMVGIGENGHLAFNDPPADFVTEEPYIIVELDEACRRQQVGEGWFATLDDVPKQAISMSIRQIMKAENIICSVPDARKALAVKNSVEEPVSPKIPASILQKHPEVELVIDDAAASLLSDVSLTRVIRV